MVSVRNLAPVLQMLFSTTAEDGARQHQVIQRVRAFTGASLCQTLVFGYLDDPHASLAQLCQAAATCQVQVTRQAIDQRLDDAMGERIGDWLADLLQRAVQQAITGTPSLLPVLARFGAIWIEDSSVLPLPDALAQQWPGCGGSAGTSGAALKLGVRQNLVTGEQQGPLLAPGRLHDRVLAEQHPPLEAGSLYLADLGYFSLARFEALTAAGVQLLSRLRAGTQLVDAHGRAWDAAAFLAAEGTAQVDVPVRLGVRTRFPCRLLAVRVPEAVAAERRRRLHAEARREGRTPGKAVLAQAAWTVLLTTVPAAQLSLPEAFALLHARWQLELLWKGWKTDGGVRTSRSSRPTPRAPRRGLRQTPGAGGPAVGPAHHARPPSPGQPCPRGDRHPRRHSAAGRRHLARARHPGCPAADRPVVCPQRPRSSPSPQTLHRPDPSESGACMLKLTPMGFDSSNPFRRPEGRDLPRDAAGPIYRTHTPTPYNLSST